MTRHRVGALLFLMMALSLIGHASGAAPVAVTVGVVDFYAPTPVGALNVVPERFAADELSRLLTQAAAGRFAVAPRPAMEQAQASLHWQGTDALRFGRLRALAQAVGAEALVVGSIPLFVVHDDGGVPSPDASANTNLVLQIFDATQGRVVAETRASSYVTAGIARDLLTELALHDALVRTIPSLIGALTAESLRR